MTRLIAIALLLPLLNSCEQRANTPILDNSYDATTATKPYKNQGKSLPDCRLSTTEEKRDSSEVDGCVYYGKSGVSK